MNKNRTIGVKNSAIRDNMSTLLRILAGGLMAIVLGFGLNAAPAHAAGTWTMFMTNFSDKTITLHPSNSTCMYSTGGEQTVLPNGTNTFTFEDSNALFGGCWLREKYIDWEVTIEGLPAPTGSGRFSLRWDHVYYYSGAEWRTKITSPNSSLGIPVTGANCTEMEGFPESEYSCLNVWQKAPNNDGGKIWLYFNFAHINQQGENATYMYEDEAKFSGIGDIRNTITLHQGSPHGNPLPGCENISVSQEQGGYNGNWSCTSSSLPYGITQIVAVQNDGISSHSSTPYTILAELKVHSPRDNEIIFKTLGPYEIRGRATPGAKIDVTPREGGTPAGASPFSCSATADESGGWYCKKKFPALIDGTYQWDVTQTFNGYGSQINTNTGYYHLTVGELKVSIDPIGVDGVVPDWGEFLQIHGLGTPRDTVHLLVQKDGDSKTILKSHNCRENSASDQPDMHPISDTSTWGCNYPIPEVGTTWDVTATQYRPHGEEVQDPAKTSFSVKTAAPLLVHKQKDSSDRNDKITLSGTATPGATVKVTTKQGPQCLVNVTANSSGLHIPTPWSCTLDNANAGELDFTAVQIYGSIISAPITGSTNNL
ncbi:hypothetical protein [Xenorhabdus stockiae]|uniref:hypothetical protein n=1 Tax=Xenorhabdus stockiae TaxID=351614 RepID=UPI004063E4AD